MSNCRFERTRLSAVARSRLERAEAFFVDPANDALDIWLFDGQVMQAVAAGNLGDQLGGGGLRAVELQPAARTIAPLALLVEFSAGGPWMPSCYRELQCGRAFPPRKRGLALRAQGYGDASLVRPIDVLERLGAIQLDSVNVLARNHLLVPFARIGPYSTADLDASIYTQRQGFEYWGHMASWLPTHEYRHFLPRMARMRESTRG
jgi:hypothetical protein